MNIQEQFMDAVKPYIKDGQIRIKDCIVGLLRNDEVLTLNAILHKTIRGLQTKERVEAFVSEVKAGFLEFLEETEPKIGDRIDYLTYNLSDEESYGLIIDNQDYSKICPTSNNCDIFSMAYNPTIASPFENTRIYTLGQSACIDVAGEMASVICLGDANDVILSGASGSIISLGSCDQIEAKFDNSQVISLGESCKIDVNPGVMFMTGNRSSVICAYPEDDGYWGIEQAVVGKELKPYIWYMFHPDYKKFVKIER